MDRVEQLEKVILAAKRAYYTGMPIMGDYEYDTLEKELEDLDPTNAALKMIGTDFLGDAPKVDLTYKAFSTDKSLNMGELQSFWNRTPSAREYIQTTKVDGMSAILEYMDGALVKAATRGNGDVGENIFDKVLYIEDIPKQVGSFTGQIRGEIYLRTTEFNTLNLILARGGEDQQKNSRNSTSGLINAQQIKNKVEKLQLLSFRAFGVYDFSSEVSEVGSYKNYDDQLIMAVVLGFSVVEFKTISGPQDIDYLKLEQYIKSLPYACDGVVLRVRDNRLCKSLGWTQKWLTGVTALKFKPEGCLVKVRQIEWSMGSRELTPVVIIEEIELEGARINRVGGHSVKNLIDIEAVPGNYIYVERSGGVIPRAYHRSYADQ